MDTTYLIQHIASELQSIHGIQAVALGGSRARGTQDPHSDIDLGLYYDPADPPDVAALNQLAVRLDDLHRSDLVNAPGGWGPWINGGGWLTIQGIPVDFLYRDLQKVETVVRDCVSGQVQRYYQAGHPYAFSTSIYLGETALCQPLWDPSDRVAALKGMAIPYPQAYKQAVIRQVFWEAGFAQATGKKSISRADVTYAAGSCFRGVACLLETLFAINEAYWLNEKGAVAIAAGFARVPIDLRPRIESIFASLTTDARDITRAFDTLSGLIQETQTLIAE
jgi:predicted nucleotidyltransferase